MSSAALSKVQWSLATTIAFSGNSYCPLWMTWIRPPSPFAALRPSQSSASRPVSLPDTSRVRVSYHHHVHSQTRAPSVAHIFMTVQARSGSSVKQKPPTKTIRKVRCVAFVLFAGRPPLLSYPAKMEPRHLSSTFKSNPLPRTPCPHPCLRNLLHTLSTCSQRLHPVRNAIVKEECSGQACMNYFLETERKMNQSKTPSPTAV